MIQDPGGLLARVPELEPLCQDLAVRRAVERGEPFAVYRALWWARLTGRLKEHREALALLLRTRRAFARPLKGKLFLGTFNGFGATLMGSAEAEPDGSRIAVHWVVGLFAVPLFPLGAYVVSGGARSGLSTSWNVYARVPLGLATWGWSRGVALAIALAVAWAGGAAFWSSRHRDLTVVNGLEAPLTVQVGPASATIPAGGRETLRLQVGHAAARAALQGGAVIEAVELDLLSGNTPILWNVAGAAPLYLETVIYTKKADPSAKAPEPLLYCGKSLVEPTRVDDFFKEPPRQVKMGEHDRQVVRARLDVHRPDKLEPAVFCAYWLGDQSRALEALKVAEARAVAGGWSAPVADLAVGLAFLAGPEEHERVARARRAAQPGDVAAARDHQHALEGLGRHGEVLAEAARAAAAAPDDPKAQYLHVRLLEGREGHALAEQAIARFPQDPDLLRVAVGFRAEDGDWAGAERAYRQLKAVAPGEVGRVLDEMAVALVAQGKGAEARAELAEAAKALPGRARVEAAALHVLTAAQGSGGVDERLVKSWEDGLGGPQPHLRVRVGLPPAADGLEGADQLHAALWSDPAKAVGLAARLPPVQLAQLEGDAWALAYFEALRGGAAAAARLAAHHFYGLRARPELVAFVRGEPVALPPGLSLPVRAAARLVRSRVPGLPADERAALRAAALADDRLGGLVTRAASWPAAAR